MFLTTAADCATKDWRTRHPRPRWRRRLGLGGLGFYGLGLGGFGFGGLGLGGFGLGGFGLGGFGLGGFGFGGFRIWRARLSPVWPRGRSLGRVWQARPSRAAERERQSPTRRVGRLIDRWCAQRPSPPTPSPPRSRSSARGSSRRGTRANSGRPTRDPRGTCDTSPRQATRSVRMVKVNCSRQLLASIPDPAGAPSAVRSLPHKG